MDTRTATENTEPCPLCGGAIGHLMDAQGNITFCPEPSATCYYCGRLFPCRLDWIEFRPTHVHCLSPACGAAHDAHLDRETRKTMERVTLSHCRKAMLDQERREGALHAYLCSPAVSGGPRLCD